MFRQSIIQMNYMHKYPPEKLFRSIYAYSSLRGHRLEVRIPLFHSVDRRFESVCPHHLQGNPMGKGHRDNHAARKKRGPEAFAKKAARRAIDPNHKKCQGCGVLSRTAKLEFGFCSQCLARLSSKK